MPIYLNNCKNRDHKSIFGEDAFYDLDTTGSEASVVARLRAGDFCVVASGSDIEGEIIFRWFKYTSSRLDYDKEQNACRVLCGAYYKEEQMLKIEAAEHKYYYPFFDKNGNFKRKSVI